MTTGTKIVDERATVQGYDYRPAATPQYTYFTSRPGRYWSKTWSGSDYPHVKPTYEKISWYSVRDQKWHRAKLRLDKPKRSKTDDHPYSCSIGMQNSDMYSYSRYEYGILESSKYSDSYSDWGGVNWQNEWDNNDDIALIGKLRDTIAGSDFNAGVFLREGGETLKLITNSATRIFKAFRYLKHFDVVSAAKQLGIDNPHRFESFSKSMRQGTKDMAQAVLEVQYGWRPLLQDAHGAAEFLAKTLNYPMVQTYRVRKRKPLSFVLTGQPWTTNTGVGDTRVQIIAHVSEVDTYKLSGLTDPASVIWEAVPWSFVADWFIPIGNYLAARGLSNSLTGTFVTTKTRICSYVRSGIPDNTSGLFGVTLYYGTRPKHWGYAVNVDRTISTNLFVPFPNWKPLNKVASWQHCLNAVSLLVQKSF